MNKKLFISYATIDSEFVINVAKHLMHSFDEVFYYQAFQRADQGFQKTIDEAQSECDYFIVFISDTFGIWQQGEVSYALRKQDRPNTCLVYINRDPINPPPGLGAFGGLPNLHVNSTLPQEAYSIAYKITVEKFKLPFKGIDGLPFDPNLFSYEKDIIDFFAQIITIGNKIFTLSGNLPDESTEENAAQYINEITNFINNEDNKKIIEDFKLTRYRLLNGCPLKWPEVTHWSDTPAEIEINKFENEIINKISGNNENQEFIKICYQKEMSRGKYILNSRLNNDEIKKLSGILEAIGYPVEYPPLRKPLDPKRFGSHRSTNAHVIAAVLNKYHCEDKTDTINEFACLANKKIFFPEAGPRERLFYPRPTKPEVNVAILVAGGIAPGINAVIDSIVQRHFLYAKENGYNAKVYGIKNGLNAINFDSEHGALIEKTAIPLVPNQINDPNCIVTSHYASLGGASIGTSRVDDLLKSSKREEMFAKISYAFHDFDILYIIGGDGSMKLAHALWNCANINEAGQDKKRLSIVAIPKTMDNDILWMWQSFGFLSAVEKAREIIGHLDAEIKSNPRLCVLQLFGSDSGFVVGHAVAASSSGQCDAALIPEVPFSLYKLACFIKERMCLRNDNVPSGQIVMAETAVPTDAIAFIFKDIKQLENLKISDHESPFSKTEITLIVDAINAMKDKMVLGTAEAQLPGHINLSDEEIYEICKFHLMRKSKKHIQGQTNDKLRSAALKVVSRGLEKLLPVVPCKEVEQMQPNWKKLRVMTNEPRHILRAIPPTCSDIIMGQRLGTLAVDNAMAGYTDFMISQWLTEFVLVPLQLVILGRKKIHQDGMFWKSVLAKTQQDPELDNLI